MKRSMILTLFLALLLFDLASTTHADLIVYTGTPNSTSGVVLSSAQYLYGKFSLNQQTIITDIEAYFKTNSYGYGGLTMAIYGDDGELPDLSNEIFSQTINISKPEGWAGISGIQLDLSSGDYWIGLEVRSGQYYKGDDFPHFAPFPLEYYAVYNELGLHSYEGGVDFGVWQAGWGFRVEGNPVPKPIVAPMSLMLLMRD
jgi:hypothetical protein